MRYDPVFSAALLGHAVSDRSQSVDKRDVSDEARDVRGRWTAEAGADFSTDDVALRFGDIRRWTWATRDELKQIRDGTEYRGSLGNRLLVNMAFADPTKDTTYRGAFLRSTKERVASEYTVGKQIDLPLTSFSRDAGEAGAYINRSRAAEHAAGLRDGTVTMAQFRLEPGAQMADLGATRAGVDAEVVTAGRFEITSLTHDQTVTVAYGSGPPPLQTYQQDGVTVIGLRQVGIIAP
jgi:hypothetical protein